MEIATEHAEAECHGSREDVEEGLLLDGVALHGLHVAPGHVELAVAIEADLADSGLAFGYGTAVAAGIAAYAMAVDGLPQVALADVARETFGEGAHTGRSWKLWSRKMSSSQPAEA